MTPTTALDTAAILAAARRARAEADAAEREVLFQAAAWADAHRLDDESPQMIATFGDTPVGLGGEGARQVSHFAVIEFGTTLGLSRRSAEQLFADVIELADRLPRTWARVRRGLLVAWKARRIAETTRVLSAQAAAHVDSQVAFCADRISVTALQRLIDATIASFMPGLAQDIADRAEQTQFLDIGLDCPSFTGTTAVRGELDLPDAIDLERAVQLGAEQQRELGSALPLQSRRAKALGNLARGEVPFDYNSGLLRPPADPMDAVAGPIPAPAPSEVAPGGTAAAGGPLDHLLPPTLPPTLRRPQAVLYLHLSAAALTGAPDTDLGLLEQAGRHLVTAGQIRTWLGRADRVTVRPVIDLAEEITAPGYRPPATLVEQVVLRDGTCVFPFCTRDARACDLDHVHPFDPDGPPGQTTSTNLACLCRTHHRLKTHGAWTFTQLEPGAFLWRSPHGYAFLRDQTGTRDVTPRPVDPPGSGP